MNKKINKKVYGFLLISLFAVAIVNAGLLLYFGQVTQTVTVNPSILVNGEEQYEYSNAYSIENGWEQKFTTSAYEITNDGGRNLNVGITTNSDAGITTSHDTIGLSTRWSSEVDAFADASINSGVVTLIAEKFSTDDWSSSEARITINAHEVGIDTLDDLLTMSWDVNVVDGYIAHVDVILDLDDDGISDDALVFESAKVDPSNCELAEPYPTGNQNTLGRGIVEDTSYAWLSSGAPGPGCIAVDTFYTNTLSVWKTGYQGISGDTKILRFEIEVDPWIEDSESEISNIVINGNSKVIETLSSTETIDKNGGSKTFYVNSVFDENIASGEYPIITTIA